MNKRLVSVGPNSWTEVASVLVVRPTCNYCISRLFSPQFQEPIHPSYCLNVRPSPTKLNTATNIGLFMWSLLVYWCVFRKMVAGVEFRICHPLAWWVNHFSKARFWPDSSLWNSLALPTSLVTLVYVCQVGNSIV